MSSSCDEQLWPVANGGALWRAGVALLCYFRHITDVFHEEKTFLCSLHVFSSISGKLNPFLNECKVVVHFLRSILHRNTFKTLTKLCET